MGAGGGGVRILAYNFLLGKAEGRGGRRGQEAKKLLKASDDGQYNYKEDYDVMPKFINVYCNYVIMMHEAP